jgi:L-amino acid N-acyltransferase YncA
MVRHGPAGDGLAGHGPAGDGLVGHGPLTIRPIARHDAEATRLLYNAEVVGSTATFDLRPRSRAEHHRWVERHLGAHPAVVAVHDEQVVGFASVSPYRDRPAYATTVEDSVYVDAAWRGHGVGRRLLGAVVVAAAEHGFHTVVARVEAANAASIHLHQACGFTVVGTEREVGRKFGRWLDVTILQRLL